jgi:hypothetical protein
MTFTHYRAIPAAHRSLACPFHAGTFLDFLAHCADQGIDTLAPVSARDSAVPRKSRISYILQKDPDGSWFIDQIKPESAGAIRPIATAAPAGYRAAACDSGDAFFIIEIG